MGKRFDTVITADINNNSKKCIFLIFFVIANFLQVTLGTWHPK